MKVNGNDPAEPNIAVEHFNDGMVKRKSAGTPIRLVIATEIMAATMYKKDTMSMKELASQALEAADALIEEHNNTFKKTTSALCQCTGKDQRCSSLCKCQTTK